MAPSAGNRSRRTTRSRLLRLAQYTWRLAPGTDQEEQHAADCCAWRSQGGTLRRDQFNLVLSNNWKAISNIMNKQIDKAHV
jgi:hypothetical protein